MKPTKWALMGALAGSVGTWVAPAAAQSETEESGEALEEGADAEAGATSEESAPADGEAASKSEKSADVADALDTGVTEAPGKTYYFVGARYRIVTIPQFVQNWFADGGDTVVVQQPGLEFGIREGGMEYNIFAMLGFYGFNDTPYKGKTDPVQAWEVVSSNFKILYLGADFMWSTDEFVPGLSLHYGAGVGLGLVFGGLNRVQAYPRGGANPSDPGSYEKCSAPGIGQQGVPETLGYCTGENNHYGSYSESSPTPVFPWIAGQFGLRYKIHRNFVARLDAGIMIPGAFIGIGADYGL